MRGLVIHVVAAMVVASITIAGCQQSAPSPTQAPAKVVAPAPAPTKAAEPVKATAAAPTAAPAAVPTKAPAQPTAVPAKKVAWPEKGRAVIILVPYPAGGSGDIGFRILAPILEKELGVPVEIVNKPGAGAQVGLTELAKTRPDGYTIGNANLPTTVSIYLDPNRQSAFGRKDLQPLAMQTFDPQVVAVRSGGPYKSMKDLIDTAKGSPSKIKAGTSGLLSDGHLAILQLEKAAGVRFVTVNFDGAAPAVTAMMGNHVDLVVQSVPNFTAQLKAGEVMFLGVMDKVENEFAKGVKTMEAQGYKAYLSTAKTLVMPVGVPQEAQAVLAEAVRKSINSDEHKKKMADMLITVRYMDQNQLAAYWDEHEVQVKELMELASQK